MLKHDGECSENTSMNSAALRAFTSFNRQEGQYALLLDENFDIVWHSESMTTLLGWESTIGRNATEFVHPDDLEIALQTMLQVNEDQLDHNRIGATYVPESADIRVIDVQGVWHTFEATTYNHLEDPEVGGVLCICKLVRDRSDVARSIHLLGTGADVDTVLPVVSRLAERSLGSGTRTAVAWRHGENLRVVTAIDEPAIDSRLSDAAKLVWSLGLIGPTVITDLDDPRLGGVGSVARENGFVAAFLVPIEAPTGSDIIGAMVAWGVTTVDLQVYSQSPIHVALRLAALAIADSRTKRTLRWAADHDPLTGLVNRAEFARHLDAMAGNDIVLLYIDLDDFKPINDLYGHPTGDIVLIEVGRRIAGVIGPNDFVGRLGGDEFAVVCGGTNDPLHGRDVADQIVAAIRKPIFANGVGLRVGASVGVAVGAHPLIPAVLVQRADEALYLAKNSGKNTVCLAG